MGIVNLRRVQLLLCQSKENTEAVCLKLLQTTMLMLAYSILWMSPCCSLGAHL
ncbi:unnamed protein product [Brassica oleracea var. botrytis]|uniref:Uncharacterized protein n=2 Tax=Brassica TaxID=3705 RepID=A0A0D3BRN0_BRAOL|nr:unnamed protein product [Brassica napus]